jgi:magnesium transporter
MTTRGRDTDLRRMLTEVSELLQRHGALEEWAHRQETPNREVLEQLQRRQNLADLQRRIRVLHPADLAVLIESLPREHRVLVWREADPQQAGEALVEVDPTVRETLIAATDRRRLMEILRTLDLDDLAWLADSVPDDILREVSRSLGDIEQSLLEQTIAYPEDSVGNLMSREVAVVRESQTVEEVLADLRQRGMLPEHTDRLYVVDARNVLRGALGLQTLLTSQPSTTIESLMDRDPLAYVPEEPAAEAVKAFERYDLVSAPVVNERGKLVGRLLVDAVMDFIRSEADKEALVMAGLRGAEDLFASIWAAARNRWAWLFVNLVTAFLATRFIGLFEESIEGLVALATLMPIVASIGGNTGNQTVALVIRGLALEQVTPSSLPHLIRKELVVGLVNGLLLGGVVGIVGGLLYGYPGLGLVLTAAVLLNLMIAALAGVVVPLLLQRMGRDPAQGASVLLTFITDSMGFLLFLGLASLFLRRG